MPSPSGFRQDDAAPVPSRETVCVRSWRWAQWTADGVGRPRQLAALALGGAVLPLLTVVLTAVREHLSLADDLLLYLLVVLGVTIVGGLWPAIVAAVAAGLCLNFYFTPPLHDWTIRAPQNVAALLLFVVAAVTVSGVVHVAARESARSRRSAAEAQDLVDLAQTVLRDDEPAAVLAHLSESRGVVSELDEQRDGRWVPLAGSVDGGPVTTIDVRDDLRLRVAATRTGVSRRLLEGVAAQAAAALDRSRARTQAAEVEALEQADRIRTALLAAVSHDLRTPLAAVKAGVSSLAQTDVRWSDSDRNDLVLTIAEGTQRLEHIINNLLDMSRVQTGTVRPVLRALALDEVLPLALVGFEHDRLELDVPDELPMITADPGLLERALANVVTNAIQHSPDDAKVGLHAQQDAGSVVIEVVDHGPGVPEASVPDMFAPFGQVGDRRQHTGVGLGLAVARGFVDAMHGEIWARPTPGGGLTMSLRIPIATGA